MIDRDRIYKIVNDCLLSHPGWHGWACRDCMTMIDELVKLKEEPE